MKTIPILKNDTMDHNISFVYKDRPIEFDIVSNITEDGMYLVVERWSLQTTDFTAQSLVNYINSQNKLGFKAKIKTTNNEIHQD